MHNPAILLLGVYLRAMRFPYLHKVVHCEFCCNSHKPELSKCPREEERRPVSVVLDFSEGYQGWVMHKCSSIDEFQTLYTGIRTSFNWIGQSELISLGIRVDRRILSKGREFTEGGGGLLWRGTHVRHCLSGFWAVRFAILGLSNKQPVTEHRMSAQLSWWQT